MPAARVCGTTCHLQTLNVPNATQYDCTFAQLPGPNQLDIFTKLPLPLYLTSDITNMRLMATIANGSKLPTQLAISAWRCASYRQKSVDKEKDEILRKKISIMLQANLNNYKFNYVENGNGDNLVFVHGSASDYRTWEKQLEYFGKYYHTVVYSRRYHWPNEQIQDNEDYSMSKHVEDLEEFLKFIGNQPVHLVGHSYGALLCILLAIKNSELIHTLTLAEPPAVALYVSNIPKSKEILKLFFTKPKLALGIIKFGANGIAPTTKAFNQNNMDEALEIFGKATLGVKPFQNLSKSRLGQARANLFKAELLGSGFLPLDKNKIQNIELPTLLISGQNSPKLWQHLLVELNKLIPNSELEIIPEASHIMHEDNVSNYNTTVLTFLKKHTN